MQFATTFSSKAMPLAKHMAQAAARPAVASPAFMRVRASQPRVPPLAGGGVHGFDPSHRFPFKSSPLQQQVLRRRMSTGSRVRSWDSSLKQQLFQRAHPEAVAAKQGVGAKDRAVFPPTKWQALVQKEAETASDMDIKLQSFVAKVMHGRTAAPARKA